MCVEYVCVLISFCEFLIITEYKQIRTLGTFAHTILLLNK